MNSSTNFPTTSRLGDSPGYLRAWEPGLSPKRLIGRAILAEMESLDAEAAEVLETVRGLV